MDGCKQMGIDVPDANAEKRSAIDEVEDFVIRRDGGLGQLSQSAQHEITFAQITESELAGHKTMPEDFPVGEELAEHTIAGPQVVAQSLDHARDVAGVAVQAAEDRIRGGRAQEIEAADDRLAELLGVEGVGHAGATRRHPAFFCPGRFAAARALTGAGFRDVHIERQSREGAFDSLDDYWAPIEAGTGLIPQVYLSLPESKRRAVRDEVTERLAKFQSDGRLVMSVEMLIASGRA